MKVDCGFRYQSRSQPAIRVYVIDISRAPFETAMLQVLSPLIPILLGVWKDQSKKHGRQLWAVEATFVCNNVNLRCHGSVLFNLLAPEFYI